MLDDLATKLRKGFVLSRRDPARWLEGECAGFVHGCREPPLEADTTAIRGVNSSFCFLFSFFLITQHLTIWIYVFPLVRFHDLDDRLLFFLRGEIMHRAQSRER